MWGMSLWIESEQAAASITGPQQSQIECCLLDGGRTTMGTNGRIRSSCCSVAAGGLFGAYTWMTFDFSAR